MKKITKALLIAAALMFLLTGCFKQDTTIRFSSFGKTSAEISIVGNDEAYKYLTQGQERTEILDNIVPQIQEMITEGTKASAEQVSETVDGVEMNGVKYKAEFESLDAMLKNELFYTFNQNVLTPITSEEIQDMQNGIRLRSIQHWYGTELFVEGNINITEERFQNEIGMYMEDPAPASESAKVNMTFKFPFVSVSKANGALKPFRHSFSFTATSVEPYVPICVHTIAISIPLLIAALIILALLIALLVICKKLKKLAKELAKTKEPEAFESITDAFENAEDAVDGFAGDAGEAVEEAAEEIEETVADAAEDVEEAVADAAEDTIAPDDSAEEETENTDSGDNE